MMVLRAARNAQLSARGGFRRHVGSAGHSLGFHESPAFGIAGNGLLSKPTRKESPVRLGLFLCAKIISAISSVFFSTSSTQMLY